MRARLPHQGLLWRGAKRFGSWTSWSSWVDFSYADRRYQFFLIKKKGFRPFALFLFFFLYLLSIF
jgi:hypothetical protein